LEEKEFAAQYWFTSNFVITVTNPRSEDFAFNAVVQVGYDPSTGKVKEESRTYTVPKGGSQRFTGPVANIYLSLMSKIIAQEEDRFSNYIDPSVRAEYYDQLIAAKEDLIDNYRAFDQPENVVAPEVSAVAVEQAFPTVNAPKKPGRPPKTSLGV
jgi:hypothetical protein